MVYGLVAFLLGRYLLTSAPAATFLINLLTQANSKVISVFGQEPLLLVAVIYVKGSIISVFLGK